MHIISIDLGRYSIKFLECVVDRKSSTHVAMKEVVLSHYLENKNDANLQDLQSIQFEIVQKYLKDISGNYKLIFQIPNTIHTSRIIEVPIKNKTKAEQMIPFQLEEDIPFSLTETHITSSIKVFGEKSRALVEICQGVPFSQYFQTINSAQIIPNILTTETSAWSNYFSLRNFNNCYMLFDIGHETSKAYIFLNNQLISSHISYIAGRSIDEMIANNYHIEKDEAIIYKHQNCFFLTPEQYSSVDENQQNFAELMHKTFSTLLIEVKRWELGIKVKYGLNVDKIYITGGSSNIKNIKNYLSYHLKVDVDHIDVFDNTNFRDVDTDEKFKRRFSLAHALIDSFKNKKNTINLLSGPYTQQSSEDIPLHAISYLSMRMAAVMVVFTLFFSVKYWLLNRDLKTLDNKISNIMKNPTLEISARERSNFSKQADKALKAIKNKNKSVVQEINSIQSSLNINAISPLIKLSLIAKNSPTQLDLLKVEEGGMVEAIFSHPEIQKLEELQSLLINSNLPDAFFDLSNQNKKLKVEFRNPEMI
jgi:Tfp pilus assembly PilM family ATPase